MDYDIICVGSGITVLSYVLGLLKKDPTKRVLIIEKHRLVGGYSTCFTRPNQNSIFDVSLHKLTGMGEQGNLQKVLERYGMLSELQMVYPEVMFMASTDKGKILFHHDENFLVEALKTCCDEEDILALKDFLSDVMTYGYDSYMQHQTIMGNHEPDFKRLRFAHKNLRNVTVYDKLNEKFKNSLLREIIAIPSVYVGAFSEQIGYLYFLHIWYACFFSGTAYPTSGSQGISNFFWKEIEKLGGTFKLRETVEKIHLSSDGTRCEKIETHKATYTANKFVFNTSHEYILSLMNQQERKYIHLGQDHLPPPANSTTTLYVVLNEAPEKLGLTVEETIILFSDCDGMKSYRDRARENPKDEALNEKTYWELSPIEVTNYHLLAPSHGKVIVLNILDQIEHWPERKTQAYKEKKLRAQSLILKRLIDNFPQIRDAIKYVEVASPRTYKRYTNNTNGSGFGYLVSGKKTKIPLKLCNNIQVMSQWVSGSGYEATITFGHMLSQLEE